MRKLSPARCSVLIFFCFYLAVAHAQDSVPTHPVDGTFIKEWLVLGPFFPEDLETDFLASANGEASANPKPGDTVTTAEGKTLTWTIYHSEGNIIDLQRAIGKHEKAVCYAFCLLESDQGGDGEFLVGSDDGVVVFLNGQRVRTQPVWRAIAIDEDRFAVPLRPGKNRCLVKVSNGLQDWALTTRVLPPTRAVIAGVITDETGNALSNAIVHLWQSSTLIAKTETDTKGFYQFSVYPASGHYDIQATHEDKGNWEMGVQLSAGDRAKINLTLQKAVSISGSLFKFDNTPHVNVVVEALLLEKNGSSQRQATTLSDNRGQYKFINLRTGRYQLRCHTLKAHSENPNKIVSVDRQNTLKNVDFRFPPFKHGTWKHYTYLDGLGSNNVPSIYQDRDGFLWFGTRNGGVSRYDGEEFVNFTTDDGLAHNTVLSIYQDRDGFLWFGTDNGISQYDGKKFINFTTDDGLAANDVLSIYQDRDGFLWFGTLKNGVSRYDGEEFVNFTIDDGLITNSILSIYQDREGFLWFGTLEGLSRYDGDQFVNFTTNKGLAHNFVWSIHQDQDGLLWFGTDGGVSQYDGNQFVNLTTRDGLVSDLVETIHQDRDGFLWIGTRDNGISRYDGEKIVNFTTNDGLATNSVLSIFQDREGFFWISSLSEGLSQYDNSGFINLTTADGLAGNTVSTIFQDRDGLLWFGTDNGISQYDGKKFINFTTDDGLAHNLVRSIYQDREGHLWFATDNGISQYDGKKFINFTTDDGLAHNLVRSIYQDQDGFLWFGTLVSGVSRYDGEEFVNFTINEGLVQNGVFSIYQDREGFLWFGTQNGGVSRYDGNEFVNFTTTKGLASNSVWAIHQDQDGFFWFGTTGGVSRYDGEKFVNFTTDDGLAQNDVSSIYQDREGSLWFGTQSGGVSRYNGTSWTSLDTRDGLISNRVVGISQDSDGRLWFATLEGVSQYNPNRVPPRVRIVSVQSHKILAQGGSLETITDITTDTRVTIEYSTDTRITIKYSSIDFKTVKEKRQYRVRLKEIDSDWREPTRSDTFSISFDKPGTYTFEVVSIDRDLNYSAPAGLTLTVVLPVLPWHQNGWILYPSGGAIMVLLFLCGIFAYRYYNQRQQVLAYQREAVSELADAREMQMGLIPQTAPEVPGFEISGVCISARTVSGDFFDYVPLGNDALAVVLADVTGKGMKGAMNAILSSGALYSVAQLEMSPSEMLWALNQNLYPRFQQYTNCAMAILTIDPTDKAFRYANAGIPYPIIKRGSNDIEELTIDGMPLGAFKSSEYEETPPIELKSGNLIILFSDGITEASQRDNPDLLYMETDRLPRLIKGLDKTMNAEAVVEAIINDVRDFSGGTQQNDDMTIVVIKAL
ncbi:MAG: SpoIIE family protein phosphatase [Candidatus Poribacteria bacterium]|nr:SpoIIE family protein phosphatase [Candidatus Poribacteria bacterium]